jgi:hypothetical protein
VPATRALVPDGLAAEEHLLKLSRLRRRQSRLRGYVHDLICELPLFCGKHRRVAAPTQTSANVLVDPRFLTRDLIRESMQVPDLIEERLKFFVGDRHDWPGVRPPSNESFLTSPHVLLQEHRTELGQRVRAGIVERPEQPLASSIVSPTTTVRRAMRAPSPARSAWARRRGGRAHELLVENPQAGEHHDSDLHTFGTE